MSVDPDTVPLFSHHLMAAGFAMGLVAMLSVRRYVHAAIFLVAVIEAYAGFRYPFHVAVRDALLGSGEVSVDKATFQIRLLVYGAATGGLVLLCLVPLLKRASAGRRLMAVGMAIITATLCVELISLHSIDAILYHPTGPFARCAIIYFVGATLAAGGAVMERLRQGRSGWQSVDSLPA